MPRLVCLAVLAATCSIAAAQPPSQVAPIAQSESKDPTNAALLSIGVPVAGLLTILAADGHESIALAGLGAMYVGPSTGHWYAHRIGGIGLAVRAGALAAMVYGFRKADHQGYDCIDLDAAACEAAENQWHREEKIGMGVFYGGFALWLGSSVFDVVMAVRATRDWNREHALTIAPMMMSTPNGRATGLSLQMQF